jgi:hypothetical protein
VQIFTIVISPEILYFCSIPGHSGGHPKEIEREVRRRRVITARYPSGYVPGEEADSSGKKKVVSSLFLYGTILDIKKIRFHIFNHFEGKKHRFLEFECYFSTIFEVSIRY